MGCARSWLTAPLLRPQGGRKRIGRASYGRRSIQLPELHRVVLDDGHLLLRLGRDRRIVGARENLIMSQPGNRAAFRVVGIQQRRCRYTGKDRSQLPSEVE